jgi:hypothetical protein
MRDVTILDPGIDLIALIVICEDIVFQLAWPVAFSP